MVVEAGKNENTWSTFTPPPVQPVSLGKGQPVCSILRLDLIRSWASGNKYFKLKYAVRYALNHGISSIVSKGGMFSNHLAALSEACASFGIQLVAVIRSHAPDELNPSIQRLRANGAEIVYLSPSMYNSFGHAEVSSKYPGAMYIPEGGLSENGIQGASEIALHCVPHSPTHVIVAGGTMGTAIGLLAGLPNGVKLIIVPAWKGCTEQYVSEIIDRYQINPLCRWELWPDYHFGGFGKFDARLIEFMHMFSQSTHVPLDPVYTGKMMYGIYQRLEQGYFKAGDQLMAIHTGGLQGLEGYRYRFPALWGGYHVD